MILGLKEPWYCLPNPSLLQIKKLRSREVNWLKQGQRVRKRKRLAGLPLSEGETKTDAQSGVSHLRVAGDLFKEDKRLSPKLIRFNRAGEVLGSKNGRCGKLGGTDRARERVDNKADAHSPEQTVNSDAVPMGAEGQWCTPRVTDTQEPGCRPGLDSWLCQWGALWSLTSCFSFLASGPHLYKRMIIPVLTVTRFKYIDWCEELRTY